LSRRQAAATGGAARRFHRRVPQRLTAPPKTAQRTWRRDPWTGRLGYRRPQLFECAHLELPNAFARHAELVGQRLQRQRLVRQTARFKDPALARPEVDQGSTERSGPAGLLFLRDKRCLGAEMVIDQPPQPFHPAVFAVDGALSVRSPFIRPFISTTLRS
jgi:hypothetical protein